ncbi:Putative 115 kDa protein in type-1 retrotransposable element R1DM-like Protein [Tribolium castaneum]|uniref:115 kDa protein in type-1 retrotransposable element R1DM-like Protein n=1 Tax=Tribolium castaneum TaxID=7070 RepID=A0A139WA31_TRICA|nr:Putative 115 kDa protein in type-1 retrotransposable element R1DM-like Protein [Tribolium castaneum]
MANKQIRFMQLNMNRCAAAHDLANKIMQEERIDILLGQEPNSKKAQRLICDTNCGSFIVMGNEVSYNNLICDKDYLAADLPSLRIVSTYFSPNGSEEDFILLLESLEQRVREGNLETIISGDLNAKSPIFGSSVTNRRGILLEEFVESNNLIVLNKGDEATFIGPGGSSVIDVTLATTKVGGRIRDWRVDTQENLSDHQTIKFSICAEFSMPKTLYETGGWKITPKSWATVEAMATLTPMLKKETCTPTEMIQQITEFCNKYLPMRQKTSRRRSVFWWTKEISETRICCMKLRRRYLRLRKKQQHTEEDYKEYIGAKRALKTQIKKQKDKCWKELCDKLEGDIWGKAYKIVMGRLGPRPQTTLKDEQIVSQVQKLFPNHPTRRWSIDGTEDVPVPISTQEILEAAKCIKTKKAPGLDYLLPEVVKLAAKTCPNEVAVVFNSCLNRGEFPEIWKSARLVLIEKPKKCPSDSPTYRPICLLNVSGKLLETVIKRRLEKELRERGIPHEHQYGFRSGKSTMDAITKVLEAPNSIEEKISYKRKKFCLLITLDIENAFNSAPWDGIIAALERSGVSRYLNNIIKSYLTDRYIETAERKKIRMTCGVPQGSVLGPTLWNLFYDQILRLDMEAGVYTVAYADDLAVVVTDVCVDRLRDKAEYAIRNIIDKLQNMGIRLCLHKTEMILMSGRRKLRELTVRIGELEITTKPNLNYMGIVLDITADKVMGKLSRVLPNIGGPSLLKRKVLTSVVTSIIYYAVPTWSKVLKYNAYLAKLERITRRMALRITMAYRTSPTKALLVIAGVPPVQLKVQERCKIYQKNEKEQAQKELLQKWQESWNTYEGWTKVFIKNIELWINKKVVGVDHHVTQALTGHGAFGRYLQRIKKQDHARCQYCDWETDDARHTIFQCVRWENVRLDAETRCGRIINEETISTLLTGEEDTSDAVFNMIRSIMREKNKDGVKINK